MRGFLFFLNQCGAVKEEGAKLGLLGTAHSFIHSFIQSASQAGIAGRGGAAGETDLSATLAGPHT